MHNSFVFVHRYPHLLLDGYGWILCCSCDANRKQFVDALPNNIQLDPQKDIPYPSCIHILAMEKYLVVYDRKFGIEAKDFIEKKFFLDNFHNPDVAYVVNSLSTHVIATVMLVLLFAFKVMVVLLT
ncbi:uncharacterized protein LOC124456400 isoform X2 [Xenia sp. Carnegie-2017]|uniref:uncharacterized protein LOC124456400 isoform X2 n=1 Tax=Xenia sp. Carnegie-2017 TaxID=2897299 RepID=UPI001F045A82|nr:uncharacterized protein LOC124456400 isoform X2 [Xenia sp. Carnegie-2017]